jgi:hypothetical protein
MQLIGATRITQTIPDPFVPTIKRIISTGRNGERTYLLDDGRVVTVWPGSIVCQRCGRPLKSERSQRKGYGPCCADAIRHFKHPIPKIVIYLQEAD